MLTFLFVQTLKKNQNVSFLWELQTDDLFNETHVPCTLQFEYRLADDDVTVAPYKQKFNFTLENLKVRSYMQQVNSVE